MQIRPVTARTSPPEMRHAAAAATPFGVDSVDTGRADAPPPVLSASEAARLLMREGLDKKDTPYRVRDWAAAEDGSLYLLYSEREKGYLARLSPDAKIAWELPLQEEGLRHLGPFPGGVRVGSPSGALAVSQDGQVLRLEKSPQKVGVQWTDSAGVRYEMLDDHSLRAVDASGDPVALPALPRLNSGQRLPDGSLLLRADGEVFQLAPGGSLRHAWKLPDWPREGRTSHTATDVWPLPDGGLMLQKMSITVIPAQFDDLPPGGHMGGLWDPAPTNVSDTCLVRLAADGSVVWKSDTLGGSSRVVVLPDGTALAEGYSGGRSEVPIRRVGFADGKVAKAFEVPGSIHEFRALPDGSVLVGHSGIWSRLDAQGATLAETSSHPDHSGARLMGVLPDGRLLFQDSEGKSALRCRLETGEWEALTDPSGDHSAILAAREREQEGPPPEVIDGEGWVIIGDVQLPRNG